LHHPPLVLKYVFDYPQTRERRGLVGTEEVRNLHELLLVPLFGLWVPKLGAPREISDLQAGR